MFIGSEFICCWRFIICFIKQILKNNLIYIFFKKKSFLATYCPIDSLKTAESVCRAANGPCDIVEQCDGVTKSCPVRRFFFVFFKKKFHINQIQIDRLIYSSKRVWSVVNKRRRVMWPKCAQATVPHVPSTSLHRPANNVERLLATATSLNCNPFQKHLHMMSYLNFVCLDVTA